MPLGSYPCGAGPCGHDPIAAPSAPHGPPAGAAFLDPATRDAVLLPDGSYQSTHPVDQAAALAIMVELGTAGSAATTGQTFRQIEYLTDDLAAQVDDRARRALSVLTARGDVEYLGADVEATDAGYNAEISYRNLRLAGSDARTVAVNG